VERAATKKTIITGHVTSFGGSLGKGNPQMIACLIKLQKVIKYFIKKIADGYKHESIQKESMDGWIWLFRIYNVINKRN